MCQMSLAGLSLTLLRSIFFQTQKANSGKPLKNQNLTQIPLKHQNLTLIAQLRNNY